MSFEDRIKNLIYLADLETFTRIVNDELERRRITSNLILVNIRRIHDEGLLKQTHIREIVEFLLPLIEDDEIVKVLALREINRRQAELRETEPDRVLRAIKESGKSMIPLAEIASKVGLTSRKVGQYARLLGYTVKRSFSGTRCVVTK